MKWSNSDDFTSQRHTKRSGTKGLLWKHTFEEGTILNHTWKLDESQVTKIDQVKVIFWSESKRPFYWPSSFRRHVTTSTESHFLSSFTCRQKSCMPIQMTSTSIRRKKRAIWEHLHVVKIYIHNFDFKWLLESSAWMLSKLTSNMLDHLTSLMNLCIIICKSNQL